MNGQVSSFDSNTRYSQLGSNSNEIEYKVIFRSGLQKIIKVNVYKYDSTKFVANLVIVNYSSCEHGSSQTICILNELYRKSSDSFNSLSLRFYVTDNNVNVNGYDYDLSGQIKDLNPSPFGDVTFEEGVINNTIVANYNLSYSLVNKHLINRPTASYKVNPMELVSVTNTPVNLNGNYTINLKNSAISYIPLDGSGADAEELIYECDEFGDCDVSVNEKGIPSPTGYFDRVYGATGQSSETSVEVNDGKVQIDRYKFVYNTDNKSPVVNTEIGVLNNAKAALGSVSLGNTISLTFSVMDDNNEGLIIDSSKITVNGSDLSIVKVYLHSVSETANADQMYTHTFVIELKYTSDSTGNVNKYVFDGTITFAKGAIKDKWNFSSLASSALFELELIPFKLELVNKFIKDSEGNILENNSYSNNYYVEFEFNKKIILTSNFVSVNGVAFVCNIDGSNEKIVKCDIPTLANGSHEIKYVDALDVVGEENVKWVSNSGTIGFIKYDTVTPTIKLNGSVGVFDGNNKATINGTTHTISSSEIAEKKAVINGKTYIIIEAEVYEQAIYDTKHTFDLIYTIGDNLSGVNDVDAHVKIGENECQKSVSYNSITGKLQITNILCASSGDVKVYINQGVVDNAGNKLNVGEISTNVYVENGELELVSYSKFITIKNNIYYYINSNLVDYNTKEMVGSVSAFTIVINSGKTNAGTYTIEGENIKNSSNEIVGVNKAYIKKDVSLNFEMLFNKAVSVKDGYISIVNASRGTVSLSEDKRTVIVPLIGGTTSDTVVLGLMEGAAYYEIPGKVKYEIDAYSNISPQIEVLSGNYKVNYQGVENTGCTSSDGRFYCGIGDTITFSFEANRVLSSTDNTVLKLNNGTQTGLTLIGELDDDNKSFITFTHQITSADSYLSIESIVFGGLDMAGNAGTIDYANTRILKTEFANYIIVTTAPDFDRLVINETVYLGDSYANFEASLIRRYSNAANYNHVLSLKGGANEIVLINEELFGEIGSTVLVLTRTDKAGNSSSLEINLTVELGGEINVEFDDVEKTYDGSGYVYDSDDITVTLPRTLQELDERYNSGKLLAFVKNKVRGVLVSGNGLNFGVYKISANGASEGKLLLNIDSTSGYSSSYLNGAYSISIDEGTYKVNKTKVQVSSTNCTIIVTGQEYDGTNGYNNNFTFTCLGVASDTVNMIGTFKLDSTNVGNNVSYTISDIRVNGVNENYESVGTTAVLSGTTNVSAPTIDISNHTFNEIIKYYDGNNNVLVNEGKYSYNGKEFTIRWDSATYIENYTCNSVCEDSVVRVKLINPRIVSISSGELTTNYVITNTGGEYFAKGKLIVDSSVNFNINYYKGNDTTNKKTHSGEVIETNKNVSFDIINISGTTLSQSGVTSLNYSKQYYLSDVAVNEESITNWSNLTTTLVVESSKHVYIKVTNPSGESEIKYAYVDYVSGDVEIESIFVGSVDEENGIFKVLAADSYTYKLNSNIVIGFKFNKVVLNASNSLSLSASDSQGKYTFEEYLIYSGVKGSYNGANIIIDEVTYTIEGTNVLEGATVVGSINGNNVIVNGIEYIIEGTNVVVDGSYTFFMHEVVEADMSGNNLTIATTSMSTLRYSDKYGNEYSSSAGDKATFDTGYFVSVDRASAGVYQAQISIAGLTLNSDYISDKMVEEASGFVHLMVMILFTEDDIVSAPDKIYLKNESNSNFEIMIPRNTLQDNYIAFIRTISAGELANITGNLQVSYFSGNNSMVYFASRNLELTASEVNSVLVKNIYVDNELFTANLSAASQVKDSVVINYTCNKDCALTSSHVNAILTTASGDVTVPSSDITVNTANKTITIVNLTKGTLKVNLKTLTDKVNNVISSNTVTVRADDENMVATGIAISGCSDCTTGEIIVATVSFNKYVVTPSTDIKLNTNIGGVVFAYSRSFENKVEFTYTVNVSNIDSAVRFTSLSSNVFDDLGNGLSSLDVSSVPVTGSASIDTKIPGIPTINSTANNCTAGLCNKNSSVTVTLTFDEEIERHNNIVLETNFGNYSKTENVNVKSNVVTFVINAKENVQLDSFVITNLSGNFYDSKGNSIPLELTTNIHENTGIRLDSITPIISSISLNGCNNVDGVNYCKAGSTVSVVVTTSEALKNISSTNYPIVTLTFDSAQKGTFNNTVSLSNSNKTIAYTYNVNSNDSGTLTRLNVSVNGFTDMAGNALSSVLPTYNTNIVVDNTEFSIELRNISQDSTTNSAVVRYYCSKTRNIDCTLTGDVTDKFNVLVDGETKSGVAVTAGVDTTTGFNILTITGLTDISGDQTVTVQAKANIVSDYAGNSNEISKETLVIGIDTSEMEIAYDHYSFGVTSDCANRICVAGNELVFTIPFNKIIKEYDNAMKLNIKIGSKDVPVAVSSKSENILRFIHIIDENENGNIMLVSLTGGVVKDKDGNTSNSAGITIKEEYVNTRLTVDTRKPALASENSIVASSSCLNGLCKLNDKVIVTISFDEEIYKYSSVVIETNFGNYSSGNSTISVSGVTSITFDVNITVNNVELDKFVINKITGNFFDRVNNGFALNVSNIYENSDIKLDSKAPTITYVDVMGLNVISLGQLVPNSQIKADDMVIIAVGFSEPLANKEVVSNRASITVEFNNTGKGTISWLNTDEEDYISYIYNVSALDSGSLRGFSLSGGYLADIAGNAAVLTIDSSVINDYTVIVDNEVPTVTSVTMDKRDSEAGVSDLYFNEGDVVKFNVTFSEEVNGEPTLNIKVGSKEVNGLVGVKNADGSVSYEYTILDNDEGIIEFVSLEGTVLDTARNVADLAYTYNDKVLTVINSGYELSLVRKESYITSSMGATLVYSINTSNEYSYTDMYNKIKNNFVLLCKIDAEFDEVCTYKGFEVGNEAGELITNLEVRAEENAYNIYLTVSGAFDDKKIQFRVEYDGSSVSDIAGNEISITNTVDAITYDNEKREISSKLFTTGLEADGKYYLADGETINVEVHFNNALSTGVSGTRYDLVAKVVNTEIVIELESTNGVDYTGSYTLTDDDLFGLADGNISVSIKRRDIAFNRLLDSIVGSNGAQYTINDILDTNLYYDTTSPTLVLTHNHVNDVIRNEVRFTISCDDGSLGHESGCEDITVKIDGDEYEANDGEYIIDVSAYPNVTVVYSVVDKVGNRSASYSKQFIVDREGPYVEIKDEWINAPITSENVIEVLVSDDLSELEENASICYTYRKEDGSSDPCTTVMLVDGKVSVGVPSSDGKYVLIVNGAKDVLGNTSGYKESIEITIDNSAPITSQDKVIISEDECIVDNGTIYCGKVS